MNNIELNKTKCIGCGKCVEECPSDVLFLKENLAEIVNPALCVSCGHCAAICPMDAINSSNENKRQPFKIEIINENFKADRLLFHRKRSIRAFKDDKIQKEQIDEFIQYAEKAPSAHNLRNRKYIIITKEKDIEALKSKIIKMYKSLLISLNPVTFKIIYLLNGPAYKELSELVLSFKNLIDQFKHGNDKLFRNSKCIICIAAPTGSAFSRDDCIASQQYMMLFAKTINIDSFIIGFAQYAHKIIEKYFNLEKGYSIYSVSAFGISKYKYSKEIIYTKPEIKWN